MIIPLSDGKLAIDDKAGQLPFIVVSLPALQRLIADAAGLGITCGDDAG